MARLNPFSTHKKYLISELNKLDYTKPVICLEFGSGDGSSSIFKKYLKANKNLSVYSFENDYYWNFRISKKYKARRYYFYYSPSWDYMFGLCSRNKFYDLAFVDQSPWDARIQTIERLKNNVGVFILHDYDYFNKGVIDDIYSVGEESFFYERFGNDFVLEPHYDILPPTLILRNRDAEKDNKV